MSCSKPLCTGYVHITLLTLALLICISYVLGIINIDALSQNEKAQTALYEWKACMLQNIAENDEDIEEISNKDWKAVEHCENSTFLNQLDVLNLPYSDKAKYHLNPKKIDPVTLVSIGVGYDIDAEKKLKNLLHSPVHFFGADPVIDGNKEMYNSIGNFFPLAIGAKAGVKEASVLIKQKGYSRKRVPHVDIVYFLKSLVKKTFFDAIWLNNEGAEYEMLPLLLKGSKLDQAGITICQMNIELHAPRIEKKLPFVHQFLKTIVNEGRYVLIRPHQGIHLRAFLINFEDKKCLKKYVL